MTSHIALAALLLAIVSALPACGNKAALTRPPKAEPVKSASLAPLPAHASMQEGRPE